MMKSISLKIFIFLFFVLGVFANNGKKQVMAGNPIIPGYFADPTIKKFGDTYYIYATTDGNGASFGPAVISNFTL